MTPKNQDPHVAPTADGLSFFNNSIQRCSHFVEATGAVGDVYLLHPLMMHTASRNVLRVPRVITNPPVSLRSPFRFDRRDGTPYSLVECKTLKALGRTDGLNDWKIVGNRGIVVPEREHIQMRMKAMELKRLEGQDIPRGRECGLGAIAG
jgi:hypothetical protein